MNCNHDTKHYHTAVQQSYKQCPCTPGCNSQPIYYDHCGQTYPAYPYYPTSPLSVTTMPYSYQLPEYVPETLTDYIYAPGYLKANIGKMVRVEFAIGGNIIDRVGVLQEVGADYIVLDSQDCGGKTMCDICAIEFVTILRPHADRCKIGPCHNL